MRRYELLVSVGAGYAGPLQRWAESACLSADPAGAGGNFWAAGLFAWTVLCVEVTLTWRFVVVRCARAG